MKAKTLILLMIPLLASCGELSINSSSRETTNPLFAGLTAMDIENLGDEYWTRETNFSYQGYGYKAVGIREAKLEITDSSSSDQYDYCIDLEPEKGMISSTDWQNRFENLEIIYVPQGGSGELSISSGGQAESVSIEAAGKADAESSSSEDQSHRNSVVVTLNDANWKIENVGKTPIYLYSLSLY